MKSIEKEFWRIYIKEHVGIEISRYAKNWIYWEGHLEFSAIQIPTTKYQASLLCNSKISAMTKHERIPFCCEIALLQNIYGLNIDKSCITISLKLVQSSKLLTQEKKYMINS